MENLKIKIEKHKEIYTFSYDFGQFSLIKWNDCGVVSLHDFSVKEKRKGYGTKLFKHVLKECENRNFNKLEIISENTDEAISFWSKTLNHDFLKNPVFIMKINMFGLINKIKNKLF